jgi:hypothetical protein
MVRTLFCLKSHLWVRIRELSTPRAVLRAEVGWTSRGLEDIGSVVSLDRAMPDHVQVAVGDELLRVEWDGYRISDGDELYHTTWASLNESTVLQSPLSGMLHALHSTGLDLDVNSCLAELDVEHAGVRDATWLVEEGAYLEAAAAGPAGMFGAVESERLGYTSYG